MTQVSALSATELVSIVVTNVSNWIIKVYVRFREMEMLSIICTAFQIKEGKETAMQRHFSGNIIIDLGRKPWEDAMYMFVECVI